MKEKLQAEIRKYEGQRPVYSLVYGECPNIIRCEGGREDLLRLAVILLSVSLDLQYDSQIQSVSVAIARLSQREPSRKRSWPRIRSESGGIYTFWSVKENFRRKINL